MAQINVSLSGKFSKVAVDDMNDASLQPLKSVLDQFGAVMRRPMAHTKAAIAEAESAQGKPLDLDLVKMFEDMARNSEENPSHFFIAVADDKKDALEQELRKPEFELYFNRFTLC